MQADLTESHKFSTCYLRNSRSRWRMTKGPANRAAERPKISSPRRKPWVKAMIDKSAAERRNISDMPMMFRPSGAALVGLSNRMA